MTSTPGSKPSQSYFVDEAGDPVLFSRARKVVVGQDGCSKFFILGCLDVPDPGALALDLEMLRGELLADPLLRGVPSMRPESRKTALAFHAKDDVPEVRREVFKVLSRHPIRFFAVVRNKNSLIASVRMRNERDPHYRYNENEVYDSLVSRLFRDRLHKADEHEVTFARRGAKDRSDALKSALNRARRNFQNKFGISHQGPLSVLAATPSHAPCLQAVDYMLWALQRLYERREDRFIRAMWPIVGLIHDVDDTRQAPYGSYYDKKNMLTSASLEHEVPGA